MVARSSQWIPGGKLKITNNKINNMQEEGRDWPMVIC